MSVINKAHFGCEGCEKRSEDCHSTCVSYFAHQLERIEEHREFREKTEKTDFENRYFCRNYTSENGKKRAHSIRTMASRKKNK